MSRKNGVHSRLETESPPHGAGSPSQVPLEDPAISVAGPETSVLWRLDRGVHNPPRPFPPGREKTVSPLKALYQTIRPPSTVIQIPVTKLEASLAR